MAGAKIQSLNAALRDMIVALRNVQDMRVEIGLSLITFGQNVNVVQKLAPISDIVLPELTAGGKTPMGGALALLKQTVEDKTIVPAKAFSPTVVLVSDGLPTDLPANLAAKVESDSALLEDFLAWEPLKAFLSSERGSKCSRLAMGIGEDANEAMLNAFINSTNVPVISARDARGIEKFFRWVTMSVSSRSVSRDPNNPVLPAFNEFDDEEFSF